MTAGQNRIPVNLDFAASTPMRAEALLAQREYDDSELAGVNPNSLHSLGRKAAARLEVARREIARSFGARVRPSEIVLTNGGTEANQLALLGLAEGARQRDRKRNRVIVSAIEHDSILDNLPLLQEFGFVCEDFGGGTVLIREVPADILAADAAVTLEELAQKLALGRADPNGARDELLHTMACKSAIKAGMTTDATELAALVEKVQSGEILYCPHGRPVKYQLSKYDIEKMFKRA